VITDSKFKFDKPIEPQNSDGSPLLRALPGKAVGHCEAKKFSINSDADINYVIDGELRQSRCIEVHVEPKSLAVLA
jgi:diacylglycerol kinase family enzyme